jgi:hypothetical protein
MLIWNFFLSRGGEYPGKVCDIGFETPCKYTRPKPCYIRACTRASYIWHPHAPYFLIQVCHNNRRGTIPRSHHAKFDCQEYVFYFSKTCHFTAFQGHARCNSYKNCVIITKGGYKVQVNFHTHQSTISEHTTTHTHTHTHIRRGHGHYDLFQPLRINLTKHTYSDCF